VEYIEHEVGKETEAWDHYWSKMALPGTWGGHIELQAIADIYEVTIIVFSSSQSYDYTIVHPSLGTSKDVICLGHLVGKHYVSCVSLVCCINPQRLNFQKNNENSRKRVMDTGASSPAQKSSKKRKTGENTSPAQKDQNI
jgi:hypothetical protein